MLIRRNVVLGWVAPFCLTALFLLGREINAFGQEKAALSPSKPVPTENIKALQSVAEKSNYLGTASAKDLHGRLMLIHGGIDDNVHIANTMQFVHARSQGRQMASSQGRQDGLFAVTRKS